MLWLQDVQCIESFEETVAPCARICQITLLKQRSRVVTNLTANY
jgi:hypothetical protein